MLAILAFLLYANTLGHDFVLDDPLVITLNKYVQSGLSGWADIFTHSYRAGSSVSTDSEYMYRPLSVAAFAFEWALAPNAPGFFHFVNGMWYALVAGMLLLCLNKIMPDKSIWLLAGATLLFTVHPLHTEVVANIKSRDELMSSFFSLLTIYWYWDFVQKQDMKKLFMALSAYFLALMAKEGAATLLVIVPLSVYFLDNRRQFGQAVVQSIGLWLVFLLWFMIRWSVMKGKMGYTPDFNDNQLVAATFMERWASGFVLLAKYAQLLFWPSVLSWDYSYNQIPSANWANPLALISAIAHVGLGVYALIKAFKRDWFAFLILAYFASMALYTNQFILIGTLLGERLVFFASIWFSLALAGIIWLASGNKLAAMPENKNPGLFIVLVAVLSVAGACRTWMRNQDWKNNSTLFIRDAENAPNSFRTTRGAAEQYLVAYGANLQSPDTAKYLNLAQQLFLRSYEIRPTENALIGLGNVAYFRKDYKTSVSQFKKALELRPNNQAAKERLLRVYCDWGKYEGQDKQNYPAAVSVMQEGLTIFPNDKQLLQQIGTAMGLQNKHQEAIYYFEKALQQAPADKDLLRNLAIGYRLLGNLSKSDEYARRAGQ